MKAKNTLILVVVTLLSIPSALAEVNGTYSGSNSDDYSETQSGTTTSTDTGTSTYEETMIREYIVFASTFNDPGPTLPVEWSANLSRLDFLSGTVDGSRSRTFLRYSASLELSPGGVSDAFAEVQFVVTNATLTHGCITNTYTVAAGNHRQTISLSGTCMFNVYRTGEVTVKADLQNEQNAVLVMASYEVIQQEVYNRTVTAEYSGSSTGSYAGTATGSSTGIESGSILLDNHTSDDGSMTTSDHNVTIIDGDQNLPEMRVFAWIVGITAFMVILAEWKKDMFYYFISSLALIYVAIETPDFFPEKMRFVPLALLAYMAYRIYAEAQKAKLDVRSDD